MQLPNGTFLQGRKYKIIRKLGQGGFGITYLAENTMLHGKVAIKEFFFKNFCERDAATSQITISNANNRNIVERYKQKFVKEAQKIFGFQHPHIVRILDIFEENNTAYYVMDFVSKGSLDQKVKGEGYLSEPVAKRYIQQVAGALDYLHRQNIAHLDVKPANIMLGEGDNAILIDFGLSKQYDEASGHETSTTPVGISEGYAPMEQYRQGGVEEFSPRTDIYALGATFFKLLTGITPPDAPTILERGLDVAPLRAKGVSENAIAAIQNAMKPRKSDRTKSVQEFISQLEGRHEHLPPVGDGNNGDGGDDGTLLLGGDGDNGHGDGGSQPPANGKSYRLLLTAIISVAVAVIIFGVILLTKDDPLPINDEIPTPPPTEQAPPAPQTDQEEEGQETPVQTEEEQPVTTEEEHEEVAREKIPIYVVVKQNMMVRTGPGTDYEPKYSEYNDIYNNNTNSAVVFKGTRIKAIEESNGFVHAIQLPGHNDRDEWGEGWISKKYLELVDYEYE